MRLIFMGTPGFAVPALDALVAGGHDVVAVYTRPPRPAGRGQRERRSAVHAAAGARGLAVRTPAALRDPAEHAAFAALGADAAVVAAYGLILPRPILDAPRLGCLNVHASLLPRWRGAAPIQRAILAGDAETGITIMRMDEGLDTGPTLLREATPIGADDTAGALTDRLAAIGARLIVETLQRLARGELAATPQPADGVALAPKLAKDEARLDWAKPAAALARAVRAFDPWPGAFCTLAGERLKVLRAAAEEKGSDSFSAPGTTLDDRLLVRCGEGALRLTRVQPAGGRPMDAAEFLRGHPVPAGTILADARTA